MMTGEQFDQWLAGDGPVAITISEELEPVMGAGSVFFPPTFAPPEGSKETPGYLVDDTSAGKMATVDTVGAQANRMEPLFKEDRYASLIPKVSIAIGTRQVDLLDLGHRAADAVVRFSDKWSVLQSAFLSIRDKHDAAPLAKMAPTSLLFGVWDSRDTQVKLPRLISSTIRAYRVDKLRRSAQFFAATEKEDIQDLATQEFLSAQGLDDAPAGISDGGIIAREGIRREAFLNLIALRALTSGNNHEESLKLQRYVLGLALVALLAPAERFLRQGCLLVPKEGTSPAARLVDRGGNRAAISLDQVSALEYAKLAAADFGVGSPWSATFDKNAVRVASEKKKEKTTKKGK